jgi:hypothetical protein
MRKVLILFVSVLVVGCSNFKKNIEDISDSSCSQQVAAVEITITETYRTIYELGSSGSISKEQVSSAVEYINEANKYAGKAEQYCASGLGDYVNPLKTSKQLISKAREALK